MSNLALYRSFFRAWLEHGPEEQSLSDLKKLFRDQCHDAHRLEQQWNEAWAWAHDEGLVAEQHERYHMTRKGVRFQGDTYDLTPDDVRASVKDLLGKTHAWNAIAHQHDLPQIAGLLQFGSTVRGDKHVYGDIDLVVVWRKHPSPTRPSFLDAQSHMLGAMGVLANVDLDSPERAWQVEDRMETWLQDTRGVQLFSADVLQDLPYDEPFAGQWIYRHADMLATPDIQQDEQRIVAEIDSMLLLQPSSFSLTKASL